MSRHITVFKIDHCINCPFLKDCPVKAGKKYYYLRYEDKAWRIAMRRAYEKSDKFKDKYRWRSGVEATMSEYDRRASVIGIATQINEKALIYLKKVSNG